jgi:hypothetical protein
VGKLRAAGNAIVPQVAAEFIKAINPDTQHTPTPTPLARQNRTILLAPNELYRVKHTT